MEQANNRETLDKNGKSLKKKVMVIFPKDSEALFNSESTRTFGGASVQMYLFAKELKKNHGLDVYSLICDYEKINFKESEEFQLIKSFKENDSYLAKLIKTHRIISKTRPRFIIQHGLTNESCLMALYSYLRNIKFIFMFAHDNEVQKKFQASGKKSYLFNLIIRYSFLLIVQNKYQYNSLLEKFNPYKEKIHLLYNGFPRKNRLKKKDKIILYVARSDKWKRPDLFIQLASLLPEYKFVMICPNSGDDEYYQYLIDKSKPVKNVEFIKFVPFSQIDRYFEKASMFVNTSDYEGYPQTFIQAVMNSVPILSLKVNPDEFITTYNCGRVLNGNFGQMSDQIDLIMKNPDLYKELSDNAYDYFLNKHNISENVNKLVKFL